MSALAMRVLAALLLALVLAPPAAASDTVPGRVVVGFSAGADASSRAASRDAAGGRLVRKLALRNGAVQVLDVRRGRVRAAVRALSHRRGVRFAEPDYVGHIAGTPDDPSFGLQYGLQRIAMPAVWDYDTAGALVAVIDTG